MIRDWERKLTDEEKRRLAADMGIPVAHLTDYGYILTDFAVHGLGNPCDCREGQ